MIWYFIIIVLICLIIGLFIITTEKEEQEQSDKLEIIDKRDITTFSQDQMLEKVEEIPKDDPVIVDINEFQTKYMSCIPLDLRREMRQVFRKGEKYYEIPRHVHDKILIDRKKLDDYNNSLYAVASCNNNGIRCEKDGDIDGAIDWYEKGIETQHPACHCYDRLMIIYRRRKMFDDEIRVIDEAFKILVPQYPTLSEKYARRRERAVYLLDKQNRTLGKE